MRQRIPVLLVDRTDSNVRLDAAARLHVPWVEPYQEFLEAWPSQPVLAKEDGGGTGNHRAQHGDGREVTAPLHSRLIPERQAQHGVNIEQLHVDMETDEVPD